MRGLLDRLDAGGADDPCGCEASFDDDRLVIDAGDCSQRGRLAVAEHCRQTAIEALRERDVSVVRTACDGLVRAYEDDAAALLVAAGRFSEAVTIHDERLAERATTDPLGAATEATGRAGPVARLAAETGLADGAERVDSYDEALRPYVGPTISRSRVGARPPPDCRLVSTRDLDTGATVRRYKRRHSAVDVYHLEPVAQRLDPGETRTLAAAYDRLAAGSVEGQARAPERALRTVTDDETEIERLRPVIRKYTSGYGVFTDLFADGRVSDAFVTAPVGENEVWVRVDGQALRTNVRLTEAGANALASRFRRESGRAFSQASPTLDASVTAGDRSVRVAGVTDPTSDGVAFAFRAQDRTPWTLPALIDNKTVTARAAALLSVAVERGGAGLVAGPRGAGKTTLLGALLWEIPPQTRTITIEDTAELPVETLQSAGRDVQALESDPDGPGTAPAAALRTALRLGSGALVVGEIRGEEAGTLYEAMRVGANDGAVLGTIHGDGGTDVRERVISDLGVPESSFAVTDFLVTVEAVETAGGVDRRIRAIEEVHDGDGRCQFAPLFERQGDGLAATGRLDRGNSRLLAGLAGPDETYADLRGVLDDRERWLTSLVAAGRTGVTAVERARASRHAGRAGTATAATED